MALWKINILHAVKQLAAAGRRFARPSGRPPLMEPLEGRGLMSVTISALSGVPANIDVSRMGGNESEGAITIDPTDRNHIFIASNLGKGAGLFTAVSNDGGGTWDRGVIANGGDNLPAACCDPSAAFDEFGNLFLTYLDNNLNAVNVAISTDGGQSFSRLDSFRGNVDQPTITTGPGMVWLTYQSRGQIVATGAGVQGLGAVDAFGRNETAPGSTNGNFGDIAIGPNGQVMVTYLTPSDDAGPARIYVNVDPDGLGGAGFGPARFVTYTNIGGFRSIPAQPTGKIDAEPGLAYDRSGGPYTGRVYLVYTNASGKRPNDTNIVLRMSTNDGAAWSAPRRVNTDQTGNSQFLPRIAMDQTTGNLGIAWHDARNSGSANNQAQFFAAVGVPNARGLWLSPNFRVSRGMSQASAARNSIDYGDYTGLAFYSGNLYPLWADNSNSVGGNPNGARNKFDMYTARITVS